MTAKHKNGLREFLVEYDIFFVLRKGLMIRLTSQKL